MIENTRSIDLAATLILVLGMVAAAGPFWLVVTTASSSYAQTLEGLRLLPSGHLIENLRWVFTRTPIPGQILNSFVIALMVTTGKSVIAFLSAFGLVYFNLRGRSAIFGAILLTLMLPLEVRIVPTYAVAANLFSPIQTLLDVTGANALVARAFGHPLTLEISLLDTRIGMALPLIATATGTFLFRQFFQTLPAFLVEAARLDGAGPVAFMRHILLPLSLPTFAALGVVMFLGAWNQYLWPLMVTTDPAMRPATIGLAQISAAGSATATQYNQVMAAALLVVLPPLLVVATLQRFIVAGFAATDR